MIPRFAVPHLVAIAICASLPGVPAPARADLDDSVVALDSLREWRVRSLEVRGTEFLAASDASEFLLTRARPWYRPWEARKVLDPSTLEGDLDRLLRAYEDAGFFRADVRAGVKIVDEGPLVDVWFHVVEGERAVVGSVRVESAASSSAPSAGSAGSSDATAALADVVLPIAVGDPFTGDAYRAGREALSRALLNESHAHAKVARRATVDPTRLRVDVAYSVVAGPVAEFAETRIEGLSDVDAHLVERELRYAPGEAFSLAKIDRSRSGLLGLGLFSSVRFEIDPDDDDGEHVPIRLRLQEKPPRELRAGVGYSTEEQYGANLAWRHANWFGGGRKFSVTASYSTIKWSGDVELTQPYLFGRRHGSGQLRGRVFQEDEDSYQLDARSAVVGVERHWGESEALVTAVGFAVTYSDVSDVTPELAAQIGEIVPCVAVGAVPPCGRIREKGAAIGPILGLRWDSRNDPFSASSGTLLSFDAAQSGGIWGGEYEFYKLQARAAHYIDVGGGFVLAGRVLFGVADAIGARENLPVYERFFAGGERSVRGYQRRELGPKFGGTPAGGRSLSEASLEIRRRVWGDLGLVAFIDAGQVSLDAFDLDVSDIGFSAGPGLTYQTPIGPLSLFVGFPFDPDPTESAWQVHFSIGHFF